MRTVEKAGIAVIALATSGVGGGLYLANANGWFNHEQPISSNDLKPTTPSQPLLRDYSALSEQEIKDEATTIALKPHDFNKQYDNLRNFRGRDQLMRQAQGIVLEEAEFYRQVQKDSAVLISRARDKVKVHGRIYDLTTSKGLLFADAALEMLYREIFRVQVPWYRSDTDSLTDVEELYDRMDVLESDARPFSAANRLAYLNRALKILEGVGEQVPAKMFLDYYINDVFPSQGRVMRFNQDTFRNLGEFYMSTHPTLLEDFQKVSQNDFVNDFSAFLSNGRNFRRLILYFGTKRIKPEAESLTAEYNLFRQFLGTDFSILGQPKDLYDYQNGNIIEVDDPEERIDANNFGILLRPNPRLDRDPSWPYVRNGRLVKVINDQVQVVLDEGAHEGVEMLQVEAGEIISTEQGKFWMPLIPPQRGWLQKDYLGTIVGN